MALLHIAYLALLTNFIIFRLCGNLRIRSKYRKLWPVAIITVEYRSKSLKKINFFASHSDMCSINSTAYAFETFRTRYFNEHSFDIINEPLIYTLLRAHVNYSFIFSNSVHRNRQCNLLHWPNQLTLFNTSIIFLDFLKSSRRVSNQWYFRELAGISNRERHFHIVPYSCDKIGSKGNTWNGAKKRMKRILIEPLP